MHANVPIGSAELYAMINGVCESSSSPNARGANPHAAGTARHLHGRDWGRSHLSSVGTSMVAEADGR